MLIEIIIYNGFHDILLMIKCVSVNMLNLLNLCSLYFKSALKYNASLYVHVKWV